MMNSENYDRGINQEANYSTASNQASCTVRSQSNEKTSAVILHSTTWPHNTPKITFEWEIRSIRNLITECSRGDAIISPVFKIGISHWHMVIYPRHIREAKTIAGGYMSVYLRFTGVYDDDHQHAEICATFQFTALTKYKEYWKHIGYRLMFKSDSETANSWGFANNIKISDVTNPSGHLYNEENMLTLRCYLRLFTTMDLKTYMPQTIDVDMQNFSSYEELYKDKKFSDFIVAVNGEEFHVHKVVLFSHSKFFQALFKHKSNVKNSGKIEIKDTNISTMKLLLKYIYTKQLPIYDLEHSAKDILELSDKLCMFIPKAACESFLINSLSNNNVVELYTFADTFNAIHLKSSARMYLGKKLREIKLFSPKSYNELKNQLPLLLAEILESYII